MNRLAENISLTPQKSSATSDRWDDPDFSSSRNRTRKSAGISNIVVADENIDMFANLPLLGCNTISNAWVECPKSRQRVSQGGGRTFDRNVALPIRILAQRARNVKDQRQDYLFVRCDLLVVDDLVRDEDAGDALRNIAPDPVDALSTRACRRQSIGGRFSRIFSHVLPSSREAKSCPLRVPR